VDLSNVAFERAVTLAEQGECSELIRLEKARLKMLRGGRPKMTKAERIQATPVHKAAAMRPLAEFLLQQWYPKQPDDLIKDRAIDIAAKVAKITRDRLDNYLNRSKKNKRRLV